MTEKELLEQIVNKLSQMGEDVSDIKSKVDGLDAKIGRNYDKILEFYGYQMETNIDTTDRLKIIDGKLEMHENQIARNTADIRRIK